VVNIGRRFHPEPGQNCTPVHSLGNRRRLLKWGEMAGFRNDAQLRPRNRRGHLTMNVDGSTLILHAADQHCRAGDLVQSAAKSGVSEQRPHLTHSGLGTQIPAHGKEGLSNALIAYFLRRYILGEGAGEVRIHSPSLKIRNDLLIMLSHGGQQSRSARAQQREALYAFWGARQDLQRHAPAHRETGQRKSFGGLMQHDIGHLLDGITGAEVDHTAARDIG